MSITFTLLALLLIFFSIMMHELGHAIAMYRRGVAIEEIGFGMKIPFLPKISWTFKLKKFPSILFRINPVPLGAFVKPKEQGVKYMEQLRYGDEASIYGAGIVTNLILGLVFFSLNHIFDMEMGSSEIMQIVAVDLFLALAVYGLRRLISLYLIVPAGLFTIAYLIIAMGNHPFGEVFGGPASIAIVAHEHSRSLSEVFSIAGLVSMSIGLVNCMPIYPLDGGRIMEAFLSTIGLSEKYRDSYKIIGFGGIVLLAVFVLISDVYKLF